MWLSILDSAWFLVLYPLLLIAFLWAGFFYHKRSYLKRRREWKNIGVESTIIAIFSLLLSFALVRSGNAVHERSVMVHESGDDMAMLYRQSKFMDEPFHKEVRNYLLQYTSIVLDKPDPSPEDCLTLIHQIDALDKKLDEYFKNYLRENPSRESRVLSMMERSEVIGEVYYRLLYSFRERTPSSIIWVLIILSFIIAGLVGFLNATQEHSGYLIPLAFVSITVLLIFTIRDLDNPGKGFIKPNYEDVQSVRQWMLAE